MSWNDVDNKLKKKFDANFVACSEDYELDYIRDLVKEHYPHLEEDDIDTAIGWCCGEEDPPRPRQNFMECLKRELGIDD